jgi:hypothetical protein
VFHATFGQLVLPLSLVGAWHGKCLTFTRAFAGLRCNSALSGNRGSRALGLGSDNCTSQELDFTEQLCRRITRRGRYQRRTDLYIDEFWFNVDSERRTFNQLATGRLLRGWRCGCSGSSVRELSRCFNDLSLNEFRLYLVAPKRARNQLDRSRFLRGRNEVGSMCNTWSHRPFDQLRCNLVVRRCSARAVGRRFLLSGGLQDNGDWA